VEEALAAQPEGRSNRVGLTRPDLLQVRAGANRQRYGARREFKRTDSVKREHASTFFEKNWKGLREAGVSGVHSTLQSLVKQEKKILLLQRRVVRAVLTTLELTLPNTDETFVYRVRWWKYITDSVIRHRRSHFAMKEWKLHTQWVANSIFDRDPDDPRTPYKASWPELPKGTWLSSGEWNPEVCANAVEYCITRTLPAGDGEAEVSSLEQLRETYCDFQPTPLSGEDKEWIERSSAICGLEIKRCAIESKVLYRMDSHCSLTNRSSIEKSSREGGKKAAIIPGFHRWLLGSPSVGKVYELPTGGFAEFPADVPRWQARFPHLSNVEGNWGEPIEGSGFIHPQLNGMEEDRLSVLLHTYCYVVLLEDGYIYQNGRPTGKMFECEALALGEPGNKVRNPTKSMACLTTYLQPYAHVMRAILETDPTLHSGLSAGNQAWEFIKSMSHSYRDLKLSDLFEGALLGDLERSTDFIEFEVGRTHMDAFWQPWKGVSEYFLHAHELILQPFVLSIKGVSDIAQRGALMGLPGTKIILHTISKAIDVASTRTLPMSPQSLHSHTWRCAGDDIIRLGSLANLRRYKPSAIRYRVKPSDDKWGVYLKGGKYCERAIFLDGTASTSDLRQSAYRDIIPVRLISPETKTRSGDDDVNPTFGKGHALAKELEWYSGPSEKKSKALGLFVENFREYGDMRATMFVPRHLGGLGLSHELESSFASTHETIKKCAHLAYAEKRTAKGNLALRALQSLRTPILFYRGEPISLKHVDNLLGDLLLEFLPGADTQRTAENLGIDPHLRFYRKCELIKKSGYVNITEVLSTPQGELPAFWDLAFKKQKPGWKTAPLSARIKLIESTLPELGGMPPVTKERWSEILTDPDDLRPEPYWVHHELVSIATEDGIIPLNLQRKATGLSLRMGIANKNIFEATAIE
jgi:hypothetical protein